MGFSTQKYKHTMQGLASFSPDPYLMINQVASLVQSSEHSDVSTLTDKEIVFLG